MNSKTANKMKADKKLESKLEYSNESLVEINVRSDEITEINDYVNEFFLYFVLSDYEKNSPLKNQGHSGLFFIKNLMIYSKSLVRFFGLFFFALYYLIAVPAYVFINFKEKKDYPRDLDSLAVIRSPASYSKMIFLKKQNVKFYADSLVYQLPDSESSIYTRSFLLRLSGLLQIPWIGIRDLIKLFKMANKYLGFVSAVATLSYYRKRFAHKATFEFFLNKLLEEVKPTLFYTGNKEDRFALTEKRLCSNLRIKTVCIPHGLEYAFKMPAGLVGDQFYCNTYFAKTYLDQLYKNSLNVFLFDPSVVEKMLSRGRPAAEKKKIVFFPETLEIKKNIAIIRFLKDLGLNFFVKLHVNDSLQNYVNLVDSSQLLKDFDEAISNSICLARKSTILLEAIYNHSVPIAVLVDSKDRAYVEFMFPSLRDGNVRKVYSFSELKDLLNSLGVENV